MSILNLPIKDFWDNVKLPKYVTKDEIKYEELKTYILIYYDECLVSPGDLN